MSLSTSTVRGLRFPFVFLLLLSFPFLAPAAPPDASVTMPVGRFTVGWTPDQGLSVAVDGVPLVRQSTFYLVKSGWNGVLFDPREIPPKIVSPQFDANAGFATIEQENENAACRYSLSVRHTDTDDTLDIALTYRLKKAIPAEIEYAAAYLSGPILAGASLSGNATELPITLREIPVAPPPSGNTQEQNRLCPPFTTLSLGTRLGVLKIEYVDPAANGFRPVLFDARSDPQEWAQNFPVFWLGIGSPSQPVKFADGERTIRFRFTLSPLTNPAAISPSPEGAGITRSTIIADASVPPVPSTPLIIPTPKRLTVPPKSVPFRLNATTKIVLCDRTPGTKRAALVLQKAIRERFALALPVTQTRPAGDRNALFIGLTGKSPLLLKTRVKVPEPPEGYGIAVPYLAGRDAQGTLWAAQTAVQMLTEDDRGPYLPGVIVFDWPSLTVRGVHLFHGRHALPFHEKLMERIFSPFKLNTLVLQAEQVRWKHDPTVAPPWAGTPEQIKQEIAVAHEHGITVYPLIQSYGHMEWLFREPKNRDFAEDPDKPYAVNFTNPAAVAYLEGFDAEADTVFNAPAFHIGFDEVTMLGRFPYRSAPRTFSDLFVSAAKHWHDFFAKRGKPIWMWADMALHPSEVAPAFGTAPSVAEAVKVRAGLPKDIVMVDWQYGGHDTFPSLAKLKYAGFKKLIAATWFNPINIKNFARAASNLGAYGALQTTWCGYESNEGVLATKERRQFVAMILAAEYFWNGGSGPRPDRLPYDPQEVFARQWRGSLPTDLRTRIGWTLHLSPIGTRPFEDFAGFGRLNFPRAWQSGPQRLTDGTFCDISDRVVALYGKLLPSGDYPQEATISTRTTPDAPARTVRLLMTASHRSEPETVIGKIVVTGTNRTTFEVPLVYGKNIASWDDGIGLTEAPAVLKDATPSGQIASLRRLEITVPKGQSIASVRLISAGGESAPILFAATVLE